jgi:hypothetical protein
MERATPTTTQLTSEEAMPPRSLLCAYSPRWLSGPTPGYRGLCATWSDLVPGDEERPTG